MLSVSQILVFILWLAETVLVLSLSQSLLSELRYMLSFSKHTTHPGLNHLLLCSHHSGCCLRVFGGLFCNLLRHAPWGSRFCPGIPSLLAVPVCWETVPTPIASVTIRVLMPPISILWLWWIATPEQKYLLLFSSRGGVHFPSRCIWLPLGLGLENRK